MNLLRTHFSYIHAYEACFPYMLTGMEDSRPAKLTFRGDVGIESNVKAANVQTLRLNFNMSGARSYYESSFSICCSLLLLSNSVRKVMQRLQTQIAAYHFYVHNMALRLRRMSSSTLLMTAYISAPYTPLSDQALYTYDPPNKQLDV